MTQAPSDSSLVRIRQIGRVGNVLCRVAVALTVIALIAFSILLSRPTLFPAGTINLEIGFFKFNADSLNLPAFARMTILGITWVSGTMTAIGFFLAGRAFEFLQRGEVFHAGLGQALRRLGLWALVFGLCGGGFTLVLAGLLLLALGSAFVLAARASEENALTI